MWRDIPLCTTKALMKSQRVACLTNLEAQVLGKLHAYQAERFLNDGTAGYCQPQHIGGSRQSHHSRTLKRLEQRGLCQKLMLPDPTKKEVLAYKISPVGSSIWDMYCEHTGETSHAVPALRTLFMSLR